MQKLVKTGLVVAMGLTMTVAGAPLTANAASKTKVLSTRNIASKAVHGRQGNIYSGVKLSKVSHKLKNYRYTTWYATKKAVVKKHGKKAYVTYIKSGAKRGWVYSKYLTNGKAPFNKPKQMKNDLIATNRAALSSGSAKVQDIVNNRDTYSDLGNALVGNDYNWHAEDMRKIQAGLLNIYDVYKGRFSKTQNADLAAMAKKVDALQISDDWDSDASSTLETFSNTLGGLIADL
ncbi:hypothetical protein [Levilactobacillus acidifarinae]|uniref:D-alanyl-D-alanine carboxypeptidase n=1 Tax=Levilactobacillus acidifarinae DSM 19394 = JCM 15949 TaxID=1423715 RepID=A0A0R1LKE9_9LACO|nr:hypothetical protein [Levilactobacillus acidifarinae]KRK96333.1 hypothetical protein FD25_GL001822 [Levilactobacillus acidifarinae DSM 19394]GEO69083.1 hypothetical protein LAC03_09930 [Levilactobacillus acidifarinae]